MIIMNDQGVFCIFAEMVNHKYKLQILWENS